MKISAPVGRSAMNHPKDVTVVQKLLNGHIQRDPCRKLLNVNGKWSQELEGAIATFQKLSGGFVMTEGRLEPRTRMFDLLRQPPATFGFERRMALLLRPTDTPAEPTVEIFIYDAILTSPGSQWGHAAIDIDGKTYSRAHSKYSILERKDYLERNLEFRDAVGLVLKVSPREKIAIKQELDKRVREQKPYNIASNSCSTNVAEVLEMAGILAHDPRFQIAPSSARMVSPKELLIVVSRSSRLIKRNNYKKGA